MSCTLFPSAIQRTAWSLPSPSTGPLASSPLSPQRLGREKRGRGTRRWTPGGARRATARWTPRAASSGVQTMVLAVSPASASPPAAPSRSGQPLWSTRAPRARTWRGRRGRTRTRSSSDRGGSCSCPTLVWTAWPFTGWTQVPAPCTPTPRPPTRTRASGTPTGFPLRPGRGRGTLRSTREGAWPMWFVSLALPCILASGTRKRAS
mmetsp:Transcript_52830/g.127983  ORF Transcript_52830/g.127983 Transcript_52830/m.127983 type:complete len:206 (-) Transcript_52830:99-716(-)